MNADPNTGELVPVHVTWHQLRARAEAHRLSVPETPEAIDRELRAIESLGFEAADLYRQALDEQYDAEKLYSATKNRAIARHSQTNRSVTAVRALAEDDASDAYGDWLNKKAVVKHIHEVIQALRSKHIGLQNTNKGIQGIVGRAYGRST